MTYNGKSAVSAYVAFGDRDLWATRKWRRLLEEEYRRAKCLLFQKCIFTQCPKKSAQMHENRTHRRRRRKFRSNSHFTLIGCNIVRRNVKTNMLIFCLTFVEACQIIAEWQVWFTDKVGSGLHYSQKKNETKHLYKIVGILAKRHLSPV